MTRTGPGSTAAEAQEWPGYARRWWVLATMTVCLLVVIMGNTILDVAIPTLQRGALGVAILGSVLAGTLEAIRRRHGPRGGHRPRLAPRAATSLTQ